MSPAKLRNFWSRLLAWGVLLLTPGALLGDARADRPELTSSETTSDRGAIGPRPDEVMVRINGDTIQISQDGAPFEVLHLADTAEAEHLRRLLRDAGAEGRAVSVPVGSMIVASGGGNGKGDKPKSSPPTGNSRNGK